MSITTGPFILSSGTLLTQYDPVRFTPASASVQVQNSSGFQLKIQVGGSNYTIAAFCAATLPTNQAPEIFITPGQPQANFGALVTLVWLQKNEDSPMADGPLTAGNVQSLGLLNQNFQNVAISSPLQFLAAPPAGYVYSLFSLEAFPNQQADGDVVTNLRLYGPSATYLTVPGPISTDTTYTVVAIPATNTVSVLWTQSIPGTTEVGLLLRYDLFPLPIG